MRREQLNAFCATLPATTHVIQWGGSDGLSRKLRRELGLSRETPLRTGSAVSGWP